MNCCIPLARYLLQLWSKYGHNVRTYQTRQSPNCQRRYVRVYTVSLEMPHSLQRLERIQLFLVAYFTPYYLSQSPYCVRVLVVFRVVYALVSLDRSVVRRGVSGSQPVSPSVQPPSVNHNHRPHQSVPTPAAWPLLYLPPQPSRVTERGCQLFRGRRQERAVSERDDGTTDLDSS